MVSRHLPSLSGIATATIWSATLRRDGRLQRRSSDIVDLVSPRILARNDPKSHVEGLRRWLTCPRTVPDAVVVTEGPIEYAADLHRGQRTGLFLDQRENREATSRYAHGRLLDCFSYHGGFALRLARQCAHAEAVDISSDAVARIRANAGRNNLPHLQAREANVFDELRRLERAGERYDTIVLDPPAFAKNKAAVPNALAGYKEINLRAMRLLSPGGFLITCSCSYNVNERCSGDAARASADSITRYRSSRNGGRGEIIPCSSACPRRITEVFFSFALE